MIRQYELIDKVLAYNENADVALLNRAYVYSMKAHGNQKRSSGEPYLTHPLEVAAILADLQLDEASVCVGLLHDTLEDTLSTHDELKEIFGQEIADLTEGVTKLSRISFHNKSIAQAENFRKLFMAMTKDIRVLFVKLSDRLHNVRTIDYMIKEESKKRVTQETLDVYAPLAARIGLYDVKVELEDRAFKVLNPEEYSNIEQRMAYLRQQDDLIPRIEAELSESLAKHNIPAWVSGREKTIYSIHNKMVKKNLTFDQLTDIVAYRIIVESKKECYEVLGMIHDLYKAIPGRFKDYISNPKPNGYQSLHTSIIGPYAQRVEIQIRTHEMDEVSKYGVAAHWLYKQSAGKMDASSYKWLQELTELLQSTDDPEEFLENTKLDLFSDEVFVFTPKGDLYNLPKGATLLDFAYSLHSELGNTCYATKVNGRIMPLRTKLNNGDQVEIITKKGQKPTPGWREIVTTSKARTAINRFLRAQEYDAQVRLGRDILEKAMRRDGYSYKEKELQKVVSSYSLKNIEDVYVAMSQGRLFPKQIIGILFPESKEADAAAQKREGLQKEGDAEKTPVPTAKQQPQTTVDENVIGVDGLVSGIAVQIASCCSPLPGEPIVGIINTGKSVMIHARDCKNLTQFEDDTDRWIPVKWQQNEDAGAAFVARIVMHMIHEPGALSQMTTTLYHHEGNIVDLHIDEKGPDLYKIRCDIEVTSADHLAKILTALRNLKSVRSVERLQG